VDGRSSSAPFAGPPPAAGGSAAADGKAGRTFAAAFREASSAARIEPTHPFVRAVERGGADPFRVQLVVVLDAVPSDAIVERIAQMVQRKHASATRRVDVGFVCGESRITFLENERYGDLRRTCEVMKAMFMRSATRPNLYISLAQASRMEWDLRGDTQKSIYIVTDRTSWRTPLERKDFLLGYLVGARIVTRYDAEMIHTEDQLRELFFALLRAFNTFGIRIHAGSTTGVIPIDVTNFFARIIRPVTVASIEDLSR
jgi:hypothetical protein